MKLHAPAGASARVERLTEREGVAGIALLAMFADGIIREEEDEVLRERLRDHDVFAETPESELGTMLARLERFSRQDGAGALLRASCAAVGPDLRDAAFELAADIVEADGEVAPEESEFLEALRALLGD